MPPADRIPPHDDRIEQAALGCCLLERACADIAYSVLRPEDFYQSKHGKAFALFREAPEMVSPELSRESLTKLGLDADTLVETCESPVRVEHYCRRLLDLSARRELLEKMLRADAMLRDGGSVADARGLLQTCECGERTADVMTSADLLEFDTEHDPTCLLGRRWLCAGGSFCLFAQTGVGKSTLAVQASVCWALGLDLFGLTPTRPLKSLFVQAENDRGDLSEMVRGICNGLNLCHRKDELRERLVIASDTTHSGPGFLSWLRGLLLEHPADVCWIDPLLSFLGGDVSDQEVVSRFLRNGLNPLAQELGVSFGIVHHTPKPSRDPAARNAYTRGDFAYLGAGSAELSNWPRAILTLREVDGGYELRSPKRGSRSGLVDGAGNPTDTVLLAHGASGIYWTRAADAGAEHDTDAELADAVEWALTGLTAGTVYTPAQIREIICRRPSPYKFHREDCYKRSRLAGKVFRAVLPRLETIQPGKSYRFSSSCGAVATTSAETDQAAG